MMKNSLPILLLQLVVHLQEQFQTSFKDFKSAEKRIYIFENSLALKFETLLIELQFKVIERT